MELDIALMQITLSTALGAVIGWEREKLHKAAGYRTMALVALGVTLFTLISQHGFDSATSDVDPSRIAAQVISGIGFLGAGLIIFHNEKVHNLTTAATVWVVAAIGMAVGVQWYALAIVTTIMSLMVLLIFRKLNSNHGK